MSILFYLGILFLCYGIYNTFCYVFMLPTVNMGRWISGIGKGSKNTFAEITAISISKEFVKRYNLKWNYAEVLEKLLKRKNIYTDGTICLISRIIITLLIFIAILPVFFADRLIFCVMAGICVLWGIIEAVVIFPSKTVSMSKYKRKWTDIMSKLLLGAFFIAQIVVFALMLT